MIKYDKKSIMEYLNEDYEYCSNMIYDGENFYLEKLLRGSDTKYFNEKKEEKIRKLCKYQLDNKTYHIFHTHPKTSYGTPSVEDIFYLTSSKRKNVLFSTIVTVLGTFFIRKHTKGCYNVNSKDIKIVQSLVDKINILTMSKDYNKYKYNIKHTPDKKFSYNSKTKYRLNETERKEFDKMIEEINKIINKYDLHLMFSTTDNTPLAKYSINKYKEKLSKD